MRRPVAIVAATIALAAIVVGAFLVLRPGTAVASSMRPDVTIECSAAVGLDADACRAWGDELLREDAAPRTFEREDLRRLRLDRGLLGLAGECRIEYFLSRYPEIAIWSDELPCR